MILLGKSEHEIGFQNLFETDYFKNFVVQYQFWHTVLNLFMDPGKAPKTSLTMVFGKERNQKKTLK